MINAHIEDGVALTKFIYWINSIVVKCGLGKKLYLKVKDLCDTKNKPVIISFKFVAEMYKGATLNI